MKVEAFFLLTKTLKKLSAVFGISKTGLLSDEEKYSIIEKSYISNYKLWSILSISFVLISILLLVFL
jgi:hypothetical protein